MSDIATANSSSLSPWGRGWPPALRRPGEGSSCPRRRHAACLLISITFITSCTVGPDYKPPPSEVPAGWVGAPSATPEPPPAPAAPAPAEIPPDLARWWTIFNDPLLDSLIDRAVGSGEGNGGGAGNLDLRLAESRLRQARAARSGAGAGFWPTVDAGASATRARAPIESSNSPRTGSTGNFFRAGFDAGWEIDVFGGIRRTVEAADADLAAAEEDRRDVLISVAAEVAAAYFDLRGIQRQLVVAHENLAAQEQSAAITRQRYEGGFVSGLDAANAEAQVFSLRALIPSQEAAAQQQRYALAVLLALEPAALLAELEADAPLPASPPSVPVGLPSDLLRRRPDIRRAEAQAHATTARIGVATADLWPKFSLTGSLGLQGSKVSALSSIESNFWSVGPSVTWRIFDAGAIQANIHIQEALTDQSLDTYRKTVLTALQEVESALVAHTREQDRRDALIQAVDASRRAMDIATKRYTEGQTNFLDVLTAQRTLFATEDALAQSETAVVTDLVALYKALGGGWEEQAEADAASSPPP